MEVWLFFSISILPLIPLERWNFPDNLIFKGKIVAKFILRSHFLSICKIWQYNNKLAMGLFKKYVTCKMAYSIPFHSIPPVSHFVNFTISPPLCYSLKITNYRMREKKSFCMYGCFSCIFRHDRIFRHKWMYKQPILR